MMAKNEASKQLWLENGKTGPPEYYMEFDEVRDTQNFQIPTQ